MSEIINHKHVQAAVPSNAAPRSATQFKLAVTNGFVNTSMAHADCHVSSRGDASVSSTSAIKSISRYWLVLGDTRYQYCPALVMSPFLIWHHLSNGLLMRNLLKLDSKSYPSLMILAVLHLTSAVNLQYLQISFSKN
jgi:hypothetical protein